MHWWRGTSARLLAALPSQRSPLKILWDSSEDFPCYFLKWQYSLAILYHIELHPLPPSSLAESSGNKPSQLASHNTLTPSPQLCSIWWPHAWSLKGLCKIMEPKALIMTQFFSHHLSACHSPAWSPPSLPFYLFIYLFILVALVLMLFLGWICLMCLFLPGSWLLPTPSLFFSPRASYQFQGHYGGKGEMAPSATSREEGLSRLMCYCGLSSQRGKLA